ncbi:MAG: sulfatase-like hydrolase/transferase [Candidatus Nealsonbacteria bacterium]|nr:sulfatase-like hydrolase/transferase [Candidatus Nealsonbacteria bacterium]
MRIRCLPIICLLLVGVFLPRQVVAADAPQRPNILWITCEDISPDLGCYGAAGAITPNLDRLAADGVRYDNAFALAGVCAVSRSSLITGMYSSTLGSQGMRSRTRLPEHVKCFSELLRDAGYYCTNRSKTDYNFPVPPNAWDKSSGKAHWRDRKPDQPFFAVFNFTMTHESQIRCPEARYQQHLTRVPQRLRHDPAKTAVPPFHPDTPEVRRDWARYHDLITGMDLKVADVLKQLDDDGLAEQTIVFFYSDHGAGMPRCKKWSYDSGTRVPLIVRFPKAFSHLSADKPGTATDRLVSFVDFAPTVLSLVGLPIPEHTQGRAFLGRQATPPREYVYTIRDRMAERHDMVRGVRSKRYLYLRNYMPHLAFARHCSYTEEMPTTQVWQRLAAAGKLTGPPSLWFRSRKPLEELYDVQADPHQLRDLAADPRYQAVLEEMRAAHLNWAAETRDLGLLPEFDMLARSEGTTPLEMGRDAQRYPRGRIYEAAALTGAGKEKLPQLVKLLSDKDPAIRYWAAVGLGALGEDARPAKADLVAALKDDSPVVRLAATEALHRSQSGDDVLPSAIAALSHDSPWVRLRAATLIELLGDAARPALPAVKEALKKKSQFGYENRLLTRLAKELAAQR